MAKTVMVVDDSVIYRKNIAKIISELPGVEVVEQASNGKEAVRKFKENPTDLVTLDIEMPMLNGIDTIPEILKIKSRTMILMISSLTAAGASETFEALKRGALDYVTKQQAFGLSTNQQEELRIVVMQKVAGLLGVQLPPSVMKSGSPTVKPGFRQATGTQLPSVPVHAATPARPAPGGAIQAVPGTPPLKPGGPDKKLYRPSPVEVLLVGSSTGGPQALTQLFSKMKPARNYAIVVTQHMPPIFTAQLAQNIQRATRHQAKEAAEGDILKKGEIIIAPGGKHLLLDKGPTGWKCRLTETPPVNFCRPSVDVTFESVADQVKNREVVAMVLTGMGSDGAQGSKALYEKGCPILTQDKDSCIVYGMPKAVDDLNVSCVHSKPEFLINEAEQFMLRPGA